jgi:superfamily II DNA or RNA helicase
MGKFFKTAASPLLPHQKDAIAKLDDSDSLLLYHGMGSGKTLTALEAADKLKRKATVIGPASLKSNFGKEKKKHKSKGKFKYFSYHKPPEKSEHPLVIFDEAHLMGQTTSKRSTYPDTYKGKKEIYMTGTPLRNHPSELIPLMRGLGIDISRDPAKFKAKYIKEEKVRPSILARLFKGVKTGVRYKGKNLKQLETSFKGKVHYHKPSTEDYPSVSDKDISVPMSKKQLTTYKEMMKQKPSLAYKVKHGLPPSKSEAGSMNAFLSASRQISNTPRKFNSSATVEDAPKLNKATYEILKRYKMDPNYRGVTYSNYLGSGVDPMSKRLTKLKVPHTSFTGRLSDNEKKRAVKRFNEGKYKHLLISGAGAEGLDLKGVKLMQLLEPHWNTPKLDQVKARAVRYKSHAHLPKNERNVTIQSYKSILPKEKGLKKLFSKITRSKKKLSTDQYMSNLSNRKQKLNEEFLDVLRAEGSR